MTSRIDLGLAALALSFYALHAQRQAGVGQWEDALWICHLANLVVAAGLVLGSSRALAVGYVWLLIGTIMWSLYLLDGGDLAPTSILTHVGGLTIAIVGCARRGVPSGTWRAATLGFIACQLLARLMTPPESNINVAWRAIGGLRETVPDPLHLLVLNVGAALLFWLAERSYVRIQPLVPARLASS